MKVKELIEELNKLPQEAIIGAFERIGEIRNFDEWEVGDEELFVFNDGAILIELAEGREVKVRVLAGECTHIDLNLNLLEETNE